MTASRKSCALLVVVVLGVLDYTRAEGLEREKRSLPAWMMNIANSVCGGRGMAAAYRMWDAYQDMRRSNWRNCDWYYYCRGNYEAAQTGWCGRQVAAAISNTPEWRQASRFSNNQGWQQGNRYGNMQGWQSGNRFGNMQGWQSGNRFGSNEGWRLGNLFGSNQMWQDGNRFGNQRWMQGNRFGNQGWMQGGGNMFEEANRYGREGGNCAQRYIMNTMGRGQQMECRLPRNMW